VTDAPGSTVGLDRFLKAQEHGDPATYAVALRELRQGSKDSHWIWYVFPQLQGLGYSGHARYYGLRDLEEARAYLLEPTLCHRYREALSALVSAMAKGRGIISILSDVDALKTVSSATLFHQVLRNTDTPLPEALMAISNLMDELFVLIQVDGLQPCLRTQEMLREKKDQ